jgi:hypothetical protein
MPAMSSRRSVEYVLVEMAQRAIDPRMDDKVTE